MSNNLELGEGREFDRIRRCWHFLGERATAGGDDCAIVSLGTETIAISSDCSVEDTHFRAGWLSHVEIGYRATAAALSDLAAMAARPVGVTVCLGVPLELPDELVADIMDGVGEAAAPVDARVWGGDLYRTPLVSVGVTVVGLMEGPPVTRAGATPGNLVWVTGVLGGAAAAVASLQRGMEPVADCRERYARPRPRVLEGQFARDAGATAMIDLSDGLLSDSNHVAAASGVAIDLSAELVPVHPDGTLDLALTGGEDYELLFTTVRGVDQTHFSRSFAEKYEVTVTKIGEVVEGHGVKIILDGEQYFPEPGFKHF